MFHIKSFLPIPWLAKYWRCSRLSSDTALPPVHFIAQISEQHWDTAVSTNGHVPALTVLTTAWPWLLISACLPLLDEKLRGGRDLVFLSPQDIPGACNIPGTGYVLNKYLLNEQLMGIKECMDGDKKGGTTTNKNPKKRGFSGTAQQTFPEVVKY